MQKVRISAIAYYNSLPFIYGLKHKNIVEKIELRLDNPAICAEKLLNNEADIGLVPIVKLKGLGYHEIISGYCIGTVNNVNTVAIFCNNELHKIKKIYLDRQSRSSNILCQVLAEKFWKQNFEYELSKTDMPCNLGNNEACMLIGDRVFDAAGTFKYKYDLSAEWYKFTGLPFVFAVWASNKPLDEKFINTFDKAVKYGVKHIEDALNDLAPKEKFNTLKEYCTNNISYIFDTEKKAGMNLFLQLAEKYL